MEQNQQQKPTDKGLLTYILAVVIGAMMLGALLGWSLTSMSYARAFDDGDIHICTNTEIDYQKAIFELDKCQRASKLTVGGFNYAINMTE